MAPSERLPVAPTVLLWARQTAGLDEEEAASRIAVSRGILAAWESGSLEPTIEQLRAASRVYRRPLAVLLLPEAPLDFQPLRDFRRLPEASARAAWSPALHAEFKRAVTQREVFLELGQLSPSSLVGRRTELVIDSRTPADEVAARLRDALALDDLPPRLWSSPGEALNACIRATEMLGMLVIQTRGITTAEMRGFSISDTPFSVIALNGRDSPRARLFTLFHELCHVALASGGVCDLHETQPLRDASDRIEHYCNEVAASTLLPRERVLSHPTVEQAGRGHAWTLPELATLSRAFGASSEAVLLRLITLDRATWRLYRVLKPQLEQEYAETLERQRARRAEWEGGPSFYVMKARDLGHGYVASIIDAYRARSISSLDAADYLDVRLDQLDRLEAVLG